VTPAIRCAGLTKRFGAATALDGLDLEVFPGEIHGFLGPNGAGKTVTMRILLGLLRCDGGEVTVLGCDPWSDAVALHRRMAYVPGDTNLWPNLTGGEIIDLLGDLRGGLDPARRAHLVQRFELDLRIKARAYSKGNRQKVVLVAAMASDAELLVLDEPTSGLDPIMEAIFREHVLEARAAGRAVLLSSHVLAEVEQVCDRVTIIRHCRTVESGSLDDLRHLTRTTIDVRVRRPATDLAHLDGVHDFREHDGHLVFEVDGERLEAVVAHLAPLGVQSLTSQPPTLEALFLRHYRDQLDEST
jgi:ABC-2 type transport system ATP-binding protein